MTFASWVQKLYERKKFMNTLFLLICKHRKIDKVRLTNYNQVNDYNTNESFLTAYYLEYYMAAKGPLVDLMLFHPLERAYSHLDKN